MTQQTTSRFKGLFPWIVWLMGACFYFYEFQLQVAPNVMVPDLMKTFGVGAAVLSGLQAAYYLGYASLQIPGGMLLDRFGPRKLLTLATLLCALGTIVFASTTSITMAEITRFFTGFGSAFALLGALVISSRWFPSNRFAFLTGLIITIGMLGAVGGEAPLAILISRSNWQNAMLLLGGIGIVLALLIYLIVKDQPTHDYSRSEDHVHPPIWQGLKRIIKSPQSWLASIYGSLVYGPTAALGALWGVSFLHTTHGYSNTQAAAFISLLYIGWAAGAPVFGGVSDRMGRRKPALYIGTFGALVASLFLIYQTNPSHLMLSAYIFFFGFFSSSFIVAFSVVRESHPSHFSGTSIGFVNMINTLGAAAAPTIIGILLDYFWSGDIKNHVHVYGAQDFNKAFTIIPIAIFMALLIIPMIKETYCKTYDMQDSSNNRQATKSSPDKLHEERSTN